MRDRRLPELLLLSLVLLGGDLLARYTTNWDRFEVLQRCVSVGYNSLSLITQVTDLERLAIFYPIDRLVDQTLRDFRHFLNNVIIQPS